MKKKACVDLAKGLDDIHDVTNDPDRRLQQDMIQLYVKVLEFIFGV